MNDKFSDGSASAYAELPVRPAYLRWTRGDAKLRALIKTDPALFFGGWRANVTNREGEPNPELPLPVVERVSEDGKHVYKAYASNVIEFLPIQHRTRFELREKVTDPTTGKEKQVIRATSKERRQGYTPVRQVFGLVFVGEKFAPAVIYIDKWSAFISFERAGQAWGKVNVPAGHALIRRYGSVGLTDKQTGDVMPNFETYGESRSTPIEAIGRAQPRFVKITPEIDQLWQDSLAWKNCERWNAEGKVDEPVEDPAPMQKFLERCNELGLSNIDIEQLVAENKGDYVAALKAIEGGMSLEDVNSQLATEDMYS